MSFFQLVRREMQGSLRRLVIMGGLGGVSSASVLAAINTGAQAADSGKPSLWSAMLFIVAVFLFVKTQSYLLLTTTAEVEAIIHRLRIRLMDHVRHSELLPLDGIGRAAIVAAATKETATLTQASTTLAFAGQGAVLIFFVAIYVAYLSLLAFALSVIIVGIAAALFQARNRQLAIAARETAEWENRLFNRLMDLLEGFKEVRLNSARSEDLYEDVIEVSRTAANIKIRTQAETFRRMVLLQSSMYAMLGAIVFVVPVISDTLGGASICEDGDRAGVCSKPVFRVGAVDPDLGSRKRRGGQHRATGGGAVGNRCARANRLCGACDAVREDRDAQHRLQVCREDHRIRIQGWPRGFQLALWRPRVHHRRKRFREINFLEAARQPLQA